MIKKSKLRLLNPIAAPNLEPLLSASLNSHLFLLQLEVHNMIAIFVVYFSVPKWTESYNRTNVCQVIPKLYEVLSQGINAQGIVARHRRTRHCRTRYRRKRHPQTRHRRTRYRPKASSHQAPSHKASSHKATLQGIVAQGNVARHCRTRHLRTRHCRTRHCPIRHRWKTSLKRDFSDFVFLLWILHNR